MGGGVRRALQVGTAGGGGEGRQQPPTSMAALLTVSLAPMTRDKSKLSMCGFTSSISSTMSAAAGRGGGGASGGWGQSHRCVGGEKQGGNRGVRERCEGVGQWG